MKTGFLASAFILVFTTIVRASAFAVDGSTIYVSGGQVGIGTTSPQTILDVNGNVTVRGQETVISTLTVQGSAFSVGGSALAVTNGNVGIGTANPGKPLTITLNSAGAAMVQISNTNNTAGDNGYVAGVGPNSSETSSRYLDMYDSGFNTSMGFISRNGANAVAYNTSSDRRLKENIVPTKVGLSTLLQLQVRDFNFISDKSKTVTQGLIAQEVQKVYPIAVSPNGDHGTETLAPRARVWGVDYGRLTPLLIKAIQDQQEIILALEKRVSALETTGEFK